jgi:hypothetical protein
MKEKILYFVKGGAPTPEQKTEAAKIGAVFRSTVVTEGDFIESCDAVYGDVPRAYRKYPVFAPPAPAADVAAPGEIPVPQEQADEAADESASPANVPAKTPRARNKQSN